MASCSSDEPGKGQDENDGGDVKYLAVQIVTPTASGSRAVSDFEVGTEKENTVNNIRFYFFDEGGNAIKVKNGINDNTYDVLASDIKTKETSTAGNIEKVLEAILIINTKEGDKLPAQVIAVINPSQDVKNIDLGSTRSKSWDYANEANNNDKFTMSNSVYATQSKNDIIKAVPISKEQIKGSAEEAKNNPVVIHVERTVAKVRAYLSKDFTLSDQNIYGPLKKAGTTESITIPTKTVEGDNVQETNQEVYVKILGWNVTAYTDKGYISKHIDLNWTPSLLSFDWNDFPNNRSYWADYCNEAKNEYINLNNISGTDGFTIDDNGSITTSNGTGLGKKLEKQPTDAKTTPSVYTNENAATNGIENTKIIVAAQLCDADGNALPVCEYVGLKMVGIDNLKKQMLSMLRSTPRNGSTHRHYYKEGNTFHEISESDITFDYVYEPESANSPKRYPVKATLTTVAQSRDWYTLVWSSQDSDPTAEQINTGATQSTSGEVVGHLEDLGMAKIYNNGLSYYYATIEHDKTATNISKWGVVRNHIYEIEVSAFYGLGTPVYDPTKEIIPEKPDDTQGYIAAQIKILSWKVKTQKVEFGK